MTAFSRTEARGTDPINPLRVLIVDDSVVMRSVIEGMLDGRPDIRVARKVPTATAALEYLASHHVDVILLDHEMPGEKGLEALPRLLEAARGAHVVMLSSHCQSGSETVVQALALGASDAIAKPTAAQSGRLFADSLVDRLRRMAIFHRKSRVGDGSIATRPVPRDFSPGCIAVGASTGGIHALKELLGGLRAPPGVPIFITQHLPEAFTPYFAQQVARMTDMPVSVPADDDVVRPDHVYLAPGARHLLFRREGRTVRIRTGTDRDPVVRALPSVNMMFAAAAQSYGDRALGIVLTGIGRDGTTGARAIIDAGGVVIAQDAQSSTVWGMPGSVARAGLASAALPPASMFDFMRQHLGAHA